MAEVRWHPRVAGVVQCLPDPITDRVLQATRLLERFPSLGMRVHDPQPPHLRRILVREWSVLYAYDSSADVVRVIGLIPPGTGSGVQ